MRNSTKYVKDGQCEIPFADFGSLKDYEDWERNLLPIL
jgi:hypothetical protein